MDQKFQKKTLKKPCGACPFKRINSNEKPNPGGSHPFVYLGQARGPFWLPCHKDKNYEGKGSNIETVKQCAGAAIFRANCEDQYKLPKELLRLPQDKESVFGSEAEFFSHYMGVPLEYSKMVLSKERLDAIMNQEMIKPSKTRRTYE